MSIVIDFGSGSDDASWDSSVIEVALGFEGRGATVWRSDVVAALLPVRFLRLTFRSLGRREV